MIKKILGVLAAVFLVAGCATQPPHQYAPHMGGVYAPAPQVAPAHVPAAPRSVSGVWCNIDGAITHEASNDACKEKARKKAEGQKSGSSAEVKSSQTAPTCSAGKTWTKLNWPGHPQHDTFVCLPDGDPHRYPAP